MPNGFLPYETIAIVLAVVAVLAVLAVQMRRRHNRSTTQVARLKWNAEGFVETFRITKAVTLIGRDKTNDVVLPYGYISRFHAKVVQKRNGEYYVVDNNSSNQVRINGQPTAESPLKDGSMFTLGRLAVEFKVTSLDQHNVEETTTLAADDSFQCRREFRRRDARLKVRYHHSRTGWRRGMVRNLSRGGMYIEADGSRLDDQDPIEVIVPLKDTDQIRWLRFIGKIVHHSDQGMGIALEDIDCESIRLLDEIDHAA